MDTIISIFLPLSLAVIMFSLGVGLTIGDFVRVFAQPKALFAGFCAQVLAIPAVAFALVQVFGLSGEMAFGVMILSICPGGVTSNMLTKLAGGTLALSISLTGVISLLSVLTVPVFVALWAGMFLTDGAIDVDITALALAMFAITTVPVVLGMLLRGIAPDATVKIETKLSRLATGLFVLIVLGALAAGWDIFLANVGKLGPLMLGMVLILLVTGWVIASAIGLKHRDRAAIAMETGIQNSTLGITLAGLLYSGAGALPAIALPSAMYGIVMYIGAVPAILLLRAAVRGEQ